MLAGLLIFLFIIFCIYLWFNYPVKKSLYDKFPGPPRLPILGNLTQLGSTHLNITEKTITWGLQYSPLRVQLGHWNNISVTNPKHVEQVLKSTSHIEKSKDYQFIKSWLGNGLLLNSGESWHRRRKLLTPAFHFSILKNFFGVFNEQALVLCDIFSKSSSDHWFDVTPFITKCTLDVICETAMGKQLNSQRGVNDISEYFNALTSMGGAVMERIVRPWLWPDFVWYRSERGRIFKQGMDVAHKFTSDVINERMIERKIRKHQKLDVVKDHEIDVDDFMETQKGKRRAFLDLMLDLKDEDKLSLEDLKAEVETFMFEGHDTTATGITWALYFLGRNVELQEKVRQEIQLIAGENDSIKPEHLAEMTYFDMFLKESQRILPSVPQIGRHFTEPLRLDDDLVIPPYTSVYIPIVAIHRNPEVYPDPLKFDPERFSGSAEQRNPFAYVPFSAGPRNCIGQRFAIMEEKVIIAQVIRKFKIEASQTLEELEPSILFVLRPTKGVWIKIKPL